MRILREIRPLALVVLMALCLVYTAQAQAVQDITSQEIAVALPHGEFAYDRDVISLRGDMWAKENVWLAFLYDERAGISHTVPPIADTTLVDSLRTAIAEYDAYVDSVVTQYQGQIASLEQELAGIEAVHQQEVDALQSEITALSTRNAELTSEIASIKAVIREVVESRGRKIGLLRQLLE